MPAGVATLARGLSVLETLDRAGRPLGIQEIARQTGIERLAVYRFLTTLERRGYVQRLENKKYRSTWRRRRTLVGYCGPLEGNSFRRDLAAGVRRATGQAGMDLLVADNREDDAAASLNNAQLLIDAKVDLAMIFEPLERIGHTIADRFFRASIPFIAIDVPLAGGVYFGANNYQAGRLAGHELARFAIDNWRGRFDRVVLVESSSVGSNVQARLTGVLSGLREKLGTLDESRVIHLDGRSHEETSREVVARMLTSLPRRTRLLISCFNDQTAVGALLAARAARREKDVAVVGQNGAEESRAEIGDPASRLIASVAYFPERYGDRLIRLAQAILNREPVPPDVYTEHVALNHENVRQFYFSGTALRRM